MDPSALGQVGTTSGHRRSPLPELLVLAVLAFFLLGLEPVGCNAFGPPQNPLDAICGLESVDCGGGACCVQGEECGGPARPWCPVDFCCATPEGTGSKTPPHRQRRTR